MILSKIKEWFAGPKQEDLPPDPYGEPEPDEQEATAPLAVAWPQSA